MKKFVYIQNNELANAPEIIVSNNSINLSPSDLDYQNDPRYYEKIENFPEPRDGFHFEEDGFDVVDKTVVMKYKYVEDPTIVKRYSKYKIIEALISIGEWTAVKSWLQEIGYLDLFNAAMLLADDDTNFEAGVNLYCQQFGKTRAEVEQLLSNCLFEE